MRSLTDPLRSLRRPLLVVAGTDQQPVLAVLRAAAQHTAYLRV